MIRNYTKFAWRNIVKNRTDATIKIAGLSLGLGMAIGIFCVVRFEGGFDMEDFAYRINIEWWLFAVAALAVEVIALLTVSWWAIPAAVANPVDALRDE